MCIMLQHKVYSLIPRFLSMSREEPGNETSLYSVLVLVFFLALPPTSSIWSLIICKTKIEAREGPEARLLSYFSLPRYDIVKFCACFLWTGTLIMLCQ